MIGWIVFGEWLSMIFCWYISNNEYLQYIGWYNAGVLTILLAFNGYLTKGVKKND